MEDEVVPADCVLISSKAVIDESMLTGESMPVTKVPLPVLDRKYNKSDDQDSTLFGGTKVVQVWPELAKIFIDKLKLFVFTF